MSVEIPRPQEGVSSLLPESLGEEIPEVLIEEFNTLAERLKIPGIQRTPTTVSLEALTENLGESRVTYLVGNQVDVPEIVEKQLLKEKVAEVLRRLPPRQRRILELRFGLNGGGGLTLEEVAVEEGVGRGRIQQIESEALKFLRQTEITAQLEPFRETDPRAIKISRRGWRGMRKKR